MYEIWLYYAEEVKTDENTTKEISTRKRFHSVQSSDLKKRVEEITASIPEDVRFCNIEIHKQYNEDELSAQVEKY